MFVNNRPTMPSFASRVKTFDRQLDLHAELPADIAVLNPFREDETALAAADMFYQKFFDDGERRYGILGINPGRHGGGLTGVPFTDFKRLRDVCGIEVPGRSSHEPSSEFVYRMIAACGGAPFFYRHFYINSVCPLGFVRRKGTGWVNYNYYDSPALYEAVKLFILQTLRQQIALGLYTREVFCMGKKNGEYLQRLNTEAGLFQKITILPHPRFIVQYRRKEMDLFIEEYQKALLPNLKFR